MPDVTEEEHEDVETICRRFSLSHQLDPSRIRDVPPSMRLFLGFVLKEHSWSTEHVTDMFIDEQGIMQMAVMAQAGPLLVQCARELDHEKTVRASLVDLLNRAEIGEKDSEWLLSYPGVKRLR